MPFPLCAFISLLIFVIFAPPPNVNYQLMRLDIETISHFIFIEQCLTLVNSYINRNEPQNPLNRFSILSVTSKLNSTGVMLIGSSSEVRDWNELKHLLRFS